ncbi:hypothetical protein BSIN_4788 [Burkholderia singularis]|uniref:Uncharacterized protein n=1 Tax=Burkholderia singularis TaxID=1503053 RepID=A0A238H9X6_9BURK|nr:hypothetical protein BSIN_4788 [Burkholderia singularis]
MWFIRRAGARRASARESAQRRRRCEPVTVTVHAPFSNQ